MARKDDNNPEKDNTAAAVDATVVDEMNDNATVEGGNTLPAVQQTTMELGAVQGEVRPEDMVLPRLKITYGVGGLAEKFTPGDLILADDNRLAGRDEPLELIIINATQYWKEYLSNEQFKSGQMPRTFMAEAEVHEAGGTTKWLNGTGPTFNRAMNIKMLIKKPEDLICGLFGIPVDGAEYAAAVMDVDKSAYRSIGPVVLSAAQFSLKKRGLLSGTFTLQTRMEKKNSNVVPIPILKLTAHNTDEVIEEIKTAFGA